ncbi:MAG TPA: PAS domain S-box protein [Opitutaceae bacterium]|nr:PAS domain S-box protein [Opitutaceae bacterium]
MDRPVLNLDVDPSGDNAWRQLSLVAILRMFALVSALWIGSILVSVPWALRTFFGVSDVVLVLAMVFASFYPLSNRARFLILEVSFLNATIVGILAYGMPPGSMVLLCFFILLGAVFYGVRGGIIAGLIGLLVIGLGAYGWMSGRLPITPHVPALQTTERDFWMRSAIAEIAALCGITGVVAFVGREMSRALLRLSMAEEKFSKAFKMCPDALLISELATGRLIEVNEGHYRITGYTREEVIGKTSIDIGTFRDAGDREEFRRALRETGMVRAVERQTISKDGRVVDILISADVFVLAGVKCALSIIQDITERKRTEAALLANEQSFRSFIENAGVGVYRSTPEGRIVMANPALLRIMGFDSFEQMTARNLESEGYEPSYPRQLFREKIEREGFVNGWEAAWKRRDGSTMFVRESATVIRDAAGTILYYDGIIEDISERMTAEQHLRESEERFRTLTSAAFEGIVITEDGKIYDINDQALVLFGYERPEMIGRSVIDFVSLEARSVVAQNIRDNSEAIYEHDLVRKDGTRFRVEARAKMTKMGGRTLRMTALQDVTERRQNEEKQKNLEEQVLQMQKMEALGTLAGGIAHDFNNILTGILGNLQIAEMDLPQDHPAFVALSSADKASRRARELVARILSFSLPRRDNRNAASLGAVALEAVELLRVGLPMGIEIKTNVDSECPHVECDPGQIHQVIMNLGTNSAHAMSARGGTISLEVKPVWPGESLRSRHPQVSAAHRVCLTLRDEGCGMEPSVLKRIFEPFYTTKEFGQGTGLGLAMVHTIMKSHNGAIVVESEPGKGTAFSLYFPAASTFSASAKVAPRITRRSGIVPFGNGRSLMLVDDEDTVISIGSNLLRRLGFVPMAYALPKEALKAFELDPAAICAVITDLTMPEMTGIELSRQILARRPDVPIIITTGYLHSDAQKNAQESGVQCVVTKPFDVKELISKIRMVLNEPEETAS